MPGHAAGQHNHAQGSKYARCDLCIQTSIFGNLRSDGEAILDGGFHWLEVRHFEIDVLPVQLSLNLGIVNVSLNEEFARLLVKRAICTNLHTHGKRQFEFVEMIEMADGLVFPWAGPNWRTWWIFRR